jgi:hypothetical protein
LPEAENLGTPLAWSNGYMIEERTFENAKVNETVK